MWVHCTFKMYCVMDLSSKEGKQSNIIVVKPEKTNSDFISSVFPLAHILDSWKPCHPSIWLSTVKRWTSRKQNTKFQMTHVIKHLSVWKNNYFNWCGFIELLNKLTRNIKISEAMFREIWIQSKWLACLRAMQLMLT